MKTKLISLLLGLVIIINTTIVNAETTIDSLFWELDNNTWNTNTIDNISVSNDNSNSNNYVKWLKLKLNTKNIDNINIVIKNLENKQKNSTKEQYLMYINDLIMKLNSTKKRYSDNPKNFVILEYLKINVLKTKLVYIKNNTIDNANNISGELDFSDLMSNQQVNSNIQTKISSDTGTDTNTDTDTKNTNTVEMTNIPKTCLNTEFLNWNNCVNIKDFQNWLVEINSPASDLAKKYCTESLWSISNWSTPSKMICQNIFWL